MPRYINTDQADEVIKTELGMYDTTELKEMLKYFPEADVMPRTKQAAIDYLEEIGWMEEHDKEITIATRNFVGLQY